jgi:4-amino-4-deoxy-L-arabinose transferase-like glycosyltransferase
VNRTALAALAGTGALAALARAPFVGAGLGPDEGGYAYVAREWARGVRLYEGIWIDRPQGLLSVYRGVVTIADHPWAFRVTALLVGVAITLLVGAIAWMLRGPLTGVAAAAIYAIVGTGPRLEGFTLNGELLAALPAAAAVACAVAWWRRGGGGGWLVAAGLFGGTAITMKQGGFDGLVAAAALASAVPPSWRARARSILLVAAGAFVPIGAILLHGLSVGFKTYWNDIVAFRASSQFHDGTRSYFFNVSFPYAKHDVLALAVVALIGVVAVARRRTERVVVLAWLAAGIAAFNIGGLFWPHYYVQLVPVLAVLAGIGATSFRSRPLLVVLCCAAVAPVAVSLVRIAAGAERIRYEKSYNQDREVAAFVRANSRPSDTIYALDSRADLYYLADRRTTFPYLWHHSPLLTPTGLALLRLHLTGPERPRIVVVYRDPTHFDRTGVTSLALRRGYRLVWKPRSGIRVYVRRPVRFGTVRPLSQ